MCIRDRFVCVKTVSSKVVRHSLTYLSVQKWLVGGVPFCVKFCVKMTHPASKTAIFTRYSLIAAQPLDLAKKVQLWLIGAQYFPMSLRWTAYVAPKPPKGPGKRNVAIFSSKNILVSKKVCCKVFFCVKTVRGKVARRSLAYLSVHKWLVGCVPFCVKFWVKVPTQLQKWWFLLDIRS